ncbi:MAG TPA: LysM peptidoglycan-binding domain-containing protein [Steroidobacteraceae bacterium]
MFLNQVSGVSRLILGCASLAALLVLGGCSTSTVNTHETDTTAASPTAVESTAEAGPQTDTEALGELPEDAGTTTVMPDAGPELKPGAPRNYVVRRGDTLWGIANMFLRDPWLWPEIWYVNPDIHNPHLIYPGDSIHLALASDGRTALQVVHGGGLPGSRLEPLLRSSPLESAIPTIPYSMIAAFLERPGVLSREEVKTAPYILALRGEHDIAGAGDELYVKKLDGQAGARYSVMHVDQALQDPEGGRQLGYLAVYTGTAQLVRPGRIAKARLTDSQRETLQGDLLISEDNTPTSDFKPHPPARPVSGEIIAVVEGEDVAGQYDVVAINRGTGDGLERGNVLTVDEVPARADDLCARIEDRSTCLSHSSETLPTEVSGTLLVFKTYEYMSYALILNDTALIHTFDRVRNP